MDTKQVHCQSFTLKVIVSPRRGCSAAHLAIKPVEWHGGVGQANHANACCSDIRQHCFVSGFPLVLLAAELSVLILDASALVEEERSSL